MSDGHLATHIRPVEEMNVFESIFPYVFPVFFVGMGLLILKVLSVVGGWSELAEAYHHPGAFHGKLYRLQSARFGFVNFSGCLTIGVSERGLYLAPVIIFRPFHRPLLIPWREIDAEPHKVLLWRAYRLTIRSHPGRKVELSARTFDNIVESLRASTGARPVEPGLG
ncbi:MAG: hypothetical protein ACOC8E_05590 [Planctomycetota bacterium]